MRREKLLRRITANPQNVRFSDLCAAAESVGFIFKRQTGSHRFYAHPRLKAIVNFQERRGMAKPYPVRQFIALLSELGDT